MFWISTSADATPAWGKTPAEIVGHQVRVIRSRKGWNQDRLEIEMRRLGFTLGRTTLSKIETGRQKATLDEAVGFAVALGVPPSAVIFGTGRTTVTFSREEAKESRGRIVAGDHIVPYKVLVGPHAEVDGEGALNWWRGFQSLTESRLRIRRDKEAEEQARKPSKYGTHSRRVNPVIHVEPEEGYPAQPIIKKDEDGVPYVEETPEERFFYETQTWSESEAEKRLPGVGGLVRLAASTVGLTAAGAELSEIEETLTFMREQIEVFELMVRHYDDFNRGRTIRQSQVSERSKPTTKTPIAKKATAKTKRVGKGSASRSRR